LFLTAAEPNFRPRKCGLALREPLWRVFSMGSFSIWHWILIIGVALLLFGGRGKVSELMSDVAQGIKAFKRGMQDDDTAAAEPKKPEPVKSIDHQPAEAVAARSESQKATSS
jgi:sec-independent protein translocase protein TatA